MADRRTVRAHRALARKVEQLSHKVWVHAARCPRCYTALNCGYPGMACARWLPRVTELCRLRARLAAEWRGGGTS